MVNKFFAVVLMANVDRLETHTNQWHEPRMKYEVCQINGYDCFNSVVDLPSCNSWIFRIAVKHQVVKVISEEVQSLQGQIWASV